jgi:RNA polymerase sigma-70 factor (ECF subfamily)
MSISKSKYPDNPEQTMWLTQTKNGNSLAFNHIVEKYQHSIYNLCHRMLTNADEAEDAVQEVFTRAYFKLDSYNDTDKFSTWLFSIASHYCIDRLRKRYFQLIPWDDLAPWGRWSIQETPQPERVLIEAEAVEEIQALLNSLPPDYRMAVILKYWQAMSYQEIAETLKTLLKWIIWFATLTETRHLQQPGGHLNRRHQNEHYRL